MALKRAFLGAGRGFFRSTILTADVVLNLFAAYQLALFILTFSRQMFSARAILIGILPSACLPDQIQNVAFTSGKSVVLILL